MIFTYLLLPPPSSSSSTTQEIVLFGYTFLIKHSKDYYYWSVLTKSYIITSLQAPGLGNEDDEWIDAEEKQPDYTGLKIQELILEDEDEIEVKDPEISEGTENAPSDGAWRKKAARKTVPAYEPRKDEESESEGATTPVDNVNETQNPATTEEVNSEESVPVIKPVVEDTESSNIDVSAPAPVPAAAPTPAPAAGGKYITPSQRRAMEAAAKGGPPPPQPSSTPSRNMMDDPDAGSIVKGAYVPPGRRAGATSATGNIFIFYFLLISNRFIE